MKVLSPSGTHPSVLELSSLCSRPSLGPRAEPGKDPLPASPKGEKVQENKLQFLISAASLLLSTTSSQRSPAEAEQGLPSLESVLREAGTRGQAAPLNKPTTRKESGIWGQQSAGDPRASRGQCWSPAGSRGVTPRKVCPGTASSAQSRGKEQPPHHSAPAHGQVLGSILLGQRATPMCQQQGCPRALQSTPVTFLKDIWCHQVVGTQVSPRTSP